MGLVNIDCRECPEPMWIEETEEVQLMWTRGREWDRLQALIDMRQRYVWACSGCGYFEPVIGHVRPQGV